MTSMTARADRRLIRALHHSERFVLAEVTAPPAEHDTVRPPVNLAFVLDRSGSMSGEKIRLARQAVEDALARLQPADRFGIVVYDDQVDVLVESTTATTEAKENALRRLAEVDARGSTNLGEGWLRGCEQVARHVAERGVDRTLLLTDGLANVGMTDPDELAHHATELRARGVATSTFGVGEDFDEALLQRMADAGGGHFYYIASAAQIRDHMTSEVGETLEVVARDAALEVTAPESVRVEAISPHESVGRGARTIVRLGDLVANQRLEVVLRLTFPYGDVGRETGVIAALTDRDGVFAPRGRAATEPARLTWSYADDAANDGQPRDRVVDAAVARQFAALARQEAIRLNRIGQYDLARRALEGVARRVRGYAGREEALRGIVAALEAEAGVYAAPMVEGDRKARFFASAAASRSRDVMGRSLRGPSA